MLPLSLAGPMVPQRLAKITGKAGGRSALAELGLVLGEEVKVVSTLGGNVILQVKDSRIALDRELANRIMVRG